MWPVSAGRPGNCHEILSRFHPIRGELVITRWLCLAFSGLCGDGGQWLDLATFPSPAEYKELGARRERERERDTRARAREAGDGR